MAIILPPTTPVGQLLYKWRQPNGTVRDFSWYNNQRLFVSAGARGLGLPTTDFQTDKLALYPGELPRKLNIGARRMEFPITIAEESFGDAVLVMDAVRKWFQTGYETKLTPGQWEITRPDGSIRVIKSYYVGGLDGDLREGSPGVFTAVAEFVAPNPYPTDENEIIRLYTSVHFGVQQIIINEGEIPAYPKWLWGFIGNATQLIATNNTTGKSFTIAYNGSGVRFIDTAPSSIRADYSIHNGIGGNRQEELVSGSDLWWFEPGENRFTLSVSDPDTMTSQIQLNYLQQYLGILR